MIVQIVKSDKIIKLLKKEKYLKPMQDLGIHLSVCCKQGYALYPEDIECPTILEEIINEDGLYKGKIIRPCPPTSEIFYNSIIKKNRYSFAILNAHLNHVEYYLDSYFADILIYNIEDTIVDKIKALPNLEIFVTTLISHGTNHRRNWDYSITFEENCERLMRR